MNQLPAAKKQNSSATDEPEELELPILRRQYPILAQLIVGFAIGIMLSPWSTGIWYAIVFFLAYEALIYVIAEGEEPYWNWQDRIGVVAAYLLGFFIGRWLAGWRNPLFEFPYEDHNVFSADGYIFTQKM